jgi:aspartate-semialdehyde dehydrogenase
LKKYKVGIIGATGMIGRRFLEILCNHPIFEPTVLAASYKSAGKTYKEALKNRIKKTNSSLCKFYNFILLDAQNDIEKITSLVDFVFCAIDMNKNDTKKIEETYAKNECPVISTNSAHRQTSDVPMIIPEINYNHTKIIKFQKERLKTKYGFIVTKPNCSIQCFVPAIHPLLDFNIEKILVCTYQAISGAGKTFDSWPEIFDNLIPFINSEEEKTETEPLKIWGEIKNGKIINKKNLSITSQCLRIPVSDGHTAAVFVSFKNKISSKEILEKWSTYESKIKNLNLPSMPKKFIHYYNNPYEPQIKYVREPDKSMSILIGRLRKDIHYDFKFISMAHNTLRGAAKGAVLTAELLYKQGFLKNKIL